VNDAQAPDPVARLVAEMRSSRKYRCVCEQTLARVARWALARADTCAAASHAARRKLHQVYGAYVRPQAHRAAERAVESLPHSPSQAQLREVCSLVLGLHSSTRERLPILESCFPAVFAMTGPPRSVVDLACGLGAFALPWMGLPPDAAYLALDIDTCLADVTNRLLESLGRPPTARCLDLLGDEPLPEADVALLLKVLPCLERQERGAAAAVLARVRCRAAVVSFPLASLGGRERGMRASYDREIRALVQSGDLQELAYPGEVFYVWRKS
jgi:16S rRNA (guanine(1405)-N(7))-methyltransferase